VKYAWIRAVYGLIPAILIGGVWWTVRAGSDLGSFSSLYRLVSRIALVYLLILLGPALLPYIPGYAHLAVQNARPSPVVSAPSHPQKLSAAALESNFVRVNRLPPNARFRCKPANRDWDYVCSYAPAQPTSPARLEFGVIVDEQRVLRVSRMLPAGRPLPSPE
jgi:hypothetical protein